MRALPGDFFITAESPEAGFGLFSAAHFIWLIIGAAAAILICLMYRRSSADKRRRIRITLASATLAIELIKTILLVIAGDYGIGRLPLHLCGFSIYFCFVHAFTKRAPQGIFSQLLYAFCMPGAVFALIVPDWVGYPLFSFMTFSGFMLHFLITIYVVMQVAGTDIVPDLRRLPACILIMLLLAVPVYLFDRSTGTNYMFLNWPSPGSPLEWFSSLGRPGYLLGYIPLMLVTWVLIYFPFLLCKKRAKNNLKQKFWST
ncbi:MAG: TIGR02206 family membrane protein [Oscillospiraceae bacterium]|nr:TIGR02206 family membrane protein [Oscillospiraceae bacterium]